MKRASGSLAACMVLVVVSHLAAADIGVQPKPAGALADYVARADESFGWKLRREGKLGGGDYAELTLTSQTWQGIVWKHQLFVFKPAKVGPSRQALMLIDGGGWKEEYAQPPRDENEKLPSLALALAGVSAQLQTPVVVLKQVPQQPIFGGMVEDQAISHTFEQFFRTNDSTWPLLLPMVKSAVRGMDAATQFVEKQWQHKLESFTVTGASKRGWTTWLVATVDPRVKAVAPMVIDMLNIVPQMKLQIDSFGEYSEQLEDYTSKGIPLLMATPPGQRLLSIVDPYSYRKQLTLPKLILLGTNDRYWPLEALNVYWNGLEGEKRVLYVPNNGHGLKDFERVLGTIMALHRSAAGELTLARPSWNLGRSDTDLSVELTSDVRPMQVLGWMAQSDTRDFRKAQWTSVPVTESEGVYRFQRSNPPAGFHALFCEAKYDGGPAPYFFSTNVQVGGAAKPAPAK